MIDFRREHPPEFVDRINTLRKDRDDGLEAYLYNSGLSLNDLTGKQMLDVGVGVFAYFGDGLRQLEQKGFRMKSRVISIDSGKFLEVKDIDQGENKKFGETEIEGLKLKDKMDETEEPRFDFIFSNFSTPYTIYNTQQTEAGQWLNPEAGENLDKKIHEVFKSTIAHMKKGGRAFFYPIYEGVVDFGKGGKRDFGNLPQIIVKELEKYQKQISFTFEPVESKTLGLPPGKRLVIEK